MAATTAATGALNQQHLDRQFEDIVVQSQNLEHYEKLFQQVLVDLENDDVLRDFRVEYESLHNSFLKCHEGEKKLIKKCTDLQNLISDNALKVRAAEELSQGDRHTIEQLKKEIERAKQRVAASRESELALKEKIKSLQVAIRELDNDLKRAPATVLNQEGTISDLNRRKTELQKILETEKGQLVSLQHEVAHFSARCEKTLDEKRAQDDVLAKTRRGIELRMDGVVEQLAMRKKMEKEWGDIKDELVKRNKVCSDTKRIVDDLQKQVRDLEEETKRVQEQAAEKDAHKITLEKKYRDKKQEFDDATTRDRELETQITALLMELKTKDAELAHARREVNKHRKIVDGFQKRNILLEEQRAEAERRFLTVKGEMERLDLEIASLAKHADADSKQVEDLTRERDILNKHYLKAVSATTRQAEWLQIKENQRRNLDHQLRGYEREAQHIRERTLQISREIADYAGKAREFDEHRSAVTEKVRSFQNDTEARQKEIADTELKLRQQLALLDAVVSERNLFAKNFLILRQEISEMTQKELGMQSLIENLNTELKKKESRATDEEEKVQKLNQEKDLHDRRIDLAQKATEKKERMIAAYSEELLKLNEIIAEADAEKAKQKRDHLSVMNERDILGTQLIQRNDELAKLYEQIRIQQSALKKGEAQYADRLRDIQHLSFRVEQLGHEFEVMRAFASRLPELRLAVNKATRELTAEQCRVRLLLDECDNPRNVHRFTTLQGSEPHTEQLFHRVNEMQQELLKKNSDLEEKSRQIADMEKLYLELKAVVARQPGPEVAEQLSVYQQSLDKKSSQLAAMQESLRQFTEHVELYRGRHQELKDEMKNLSSQYISAMKTRDTEIAKSRRLAAMGMAIGSPHGGNEPEVYVGYTAPPRPHSEDIDGSPARGSSAAAAANSGLPPAAASQTPPGSASNGLGAGGPGALPDLESGADGAAIPAGHRSGTADVLTMDEDGGGDKLQDEDDEENDDEEFNDDDLENEVGEGDDASGDDGANDGSSPASGDDSPQQ